MTPLLRSLLRADLRYFVRKVFVTLHPTAIYLPNWHIDAIVYQLMRVNAGETRRLLINQPPRSLKSICVSVAYVAWLLGHDPAKRVIVVSYSNDFAAELHRQFRRIVDAPWYREIFSAMRIEKDTGTELVTSAGGSRYATSVGGTLTGRGADLIIVDDPLKAEEALSIPARKRVTDFFGGTLLSRLNDKAKGAIIVVMQRLHEDDLSGHLLQQGNWTHLDLPSIALERDIFDIGRGKQIVRELEDVLHPERESKETLEKIKIEIGSFRFSAQYQQRPIPLEGNLIRRDWFEWYGELPDKGSAGRIVQSWDTATMVGETNDYSVCTTWLMLQQKYYLIDVFRQKLSYPDLRRTVTTLARHFSVDTILIENAGPGLGLLQDLQHSAPDGLPRPIGVRPDGSKADRMATQSSKIEARQVHLPKNAGWLDAFLLEILGFPGTRHDDQVDSLSQFLWWAAKQRAMKQADIGMPRSINDWDGDGENHGTAPRSFQPYLWR